jgi:hypothetical protein
VDDGYAGIMRVSGEPFLDIPESPCRPAMRPETGQPMRASPMSCDSRHPLLLSMPNALFRGGQLYVTAHVKIQNCHAGLAVLPPVSLKGKRE